MIAWLARRRERRQRIRQAALHAWAGAEAQRTQPPVCDRPECYDGPDVTASRLEHGCVPDWNRRVPNKIEIIPLEPKSRGYGRDG